MDEGLQALVQPPPDVTATWNGPYVNKVPLDPWGHPYNYVIPSNHFVPQTQELEFDVWSLGSGGVDGSEDVIGNWNR